MKKLFNNRAVGKAALIILTAALFTLLIPGTSRAAPKSVLLPYIQSTTLDSKEKMEEPSGIVYHPARRTLFVVSDDGLIYETDVLGKVLRTGDLRSQGFEPDLEGITVNPRNGLLYLVEEQKCQVYQVNPNTLKIEWVYSVDTSFGGKQLFKAGKNDGFEGVTLVPGWKGSPDRLYILKQNDPAVILVLDLPDPGKKKQPATLKINHYFRTSFGDLSGICYSSAYKTLFLISDFNNLLVEMTTDGRIINQFALPGDDQEGIALVGGRVMYIAQDCGKILKFILHPGFHPDRMNVRKIDR